MYLAIILSENLRKISRLCLVEGEEIEGGKVGG